MNKKGFEMTITFLIVMVLGVLVLAGLAYVLTDGFKKLRGTTSPFIDSDTVKAAKLVCEDSCESEDTWTYCCQKWDYQGGNFGCSDARLQLSCPNIDCNGFSCSGSLTNEQCTSQGGTIVGDIGDGSARCPTGTSLIGNIPGGVEPILCCK